LGRVSKGLAAEPPEFLLNDSYQNNGRVASWLKIQNPDFSQMAAGTPGTTMEDNEIPAAVAGMS
jgi:hypothetical protein